MQINIPSASFQRQHKSRILKALQITCITDATAALLYAHARQRKEQCRAVAIELTCEKKQELPNAIVYRSGN
jgi:hypothetical protein